MSHSLGDEQQAREHTSRSRSLRLPVALLLAFAFVGVLWVGLARTAQQAPSSMSAPTFQLPLLDGSGTLSDGDLRGKVVVVNFWASWCIPCREEAPLLERTWRAYRERGVVFLGVNTKDAESDARNFIDEFDMTYPNVRDLDQRLTTGFGVKGLPETFFIDHRWTYMGAISSVTGADEGGAVILGAISEDELVSNLEILLRRKGSAAADDP